MAKMKMNFDKEIDPRAVWARSKETGLWYMAKAVWCEDYAAHLHALGYEVIASIESPAQPWK